MRQTHIEQTIDFYSNDFGVIFSPVYKQRIEQLKELYALSFVELKTAQMEGAHEIQDHVFSEIKTMISFFENGAKIYKLCENFGKDLFKTNLDVPVEIIPNATETICIEFPDCISIQHSDGSFSKTVYIRQAIFFEKGFEYRGIRLQFPDYNENGKITNEASYVNINLQMD